MNHKVDKNKELSKEQKEEQRLTQARIAEETGLAKGTVNKLFNNKFTRVDTDTVDKLCDYFDCEVGDLFSRYSPAEHFPIAIPPPVETDDEGKRAKFGDFNRDRRKKQ